MGQMHRSFRNSHISVDKASRHIAFLLLPGFSHYSFSAALEPLRSANIITGHLHFTWTLVGATDRQVTASNGVTTLADLTLDELDPRKLAPGTLSCLAAAWVCGSLPASSRAQK